MQPDERPVVSFLMIFKLISLAQKLHWMMWM